MVDEIRFIDIRKGVATILNHSQFTKQAKTLLEERERERWVIYSLGALGQAIG